MAVSGSQKTQIGRTLSGVGKKQTFTAKEVSGGGAVVGRGLIKSLRLNRTRLIG